MQDDNNQGSKAPIARVLGFACLKFAQVLMAIGLLLLIWACLLGSWNWPNLLLAAAVVVGMFLAQGHGFKHVVGMIGCAIASGWMLRLINEGIDIHSRSITNEQATIFAVATVCGYVVFYIACYVYGDKHFRAWLDTKTKPAEKP